MVVLSTLLPTAAVAQDPMMSELDPVCCLIPPGGSDRDISEIFRNEYNEQMTSVHDLAPRAKLVRTSAPTSRGGFSDHIRNMRGFGNMKG